MFLSIAIYVEICNSGICGIVSIGGGDSDVDDKDDGCSDPSLFFEISYAGAAHKAWELI